MNTNPNAKRILIYGDSNTWGDTPEQGRFRFSPKERYTGVLQDLLGNDYEIIEEGLGGRTICATSPREEEKGRVGVNYLRPCLVSHAPLDLFVIHLGTNEFKKQFNLTAKDVASNLEKMCTLTTEIQDDIVKRHSMQSFRTLILTPGYVDEAKAGEKFAGFGRLGHEIVPLFEEVAKKFNFHFLDVSDIAITGADGTHYSLDSHRKIAEALSKKVKDILVN